MFGIETGLAGGFVLLSLLVAGLVFILYLVPVPLWIAAWASGASRVTVRTKKWLRLLAAPILTMLDGRQIL